MYYGGVFFWMPYIARTKIRSGGHSGEDPDLLHGGISRTETSERRILGFC
jgi:hypothetical protein